MIYLIIIIILIGLIYVLNKKSRNFESFSSESIENIVKLYDGSNNSFLIRGNLDVSGNINNIKSTSIIINSQDGKNQNKFIIGSTEKNRDVDASGFSHPYLYITPENENMIDDNKWNWLKGVRITNSGNLQSNGMVATIVEVADTDLNNKTLLDKAVTYFSLNEPDGTYKYMIFKGKKNRNIWAATFVKNKSRIYRMPTFVSTNTSKESGWQKHIADMDTYQNSDWFRDIPNP